jgi:hypothetical protein
VFTSLQHRTAYTFNTYPIPFKVNTGDRGGEVNNLKGSEYFAAMGRTKHRRGSQKNKIK